jgi:hypothetical protein
MRQGFNPHKDKPQEKSYYTHQIIIPVFIPKEEGYFKDSFKIFKLCLQSLFATIHDKTFVTIVNNGSDENVVNYLDTLFQEKSIQELIHTQNIGKVNAIFKGLCGNNIELVTIADSDVLFLSHWQLATNNVYAAFPKAGVVGIVPQFTTFTTRCDNILFDYFFNKKLQFIPIINPNALWRFYESIGWDSCNPDYLKLGLGIVSDQNCKAFLGSGHFVATYKKDMFDEMVTYNNFKLGGKSEDYLDTCPLKKDYWRLTTEDNYAYHMGNVYEEWMGEITFETDKNAIFQSDFPTSKKINKIHYFIKNDLFRKFFKQKGVMRLFYKYKKMPREMILNY